MNRAKRNIKLAPAFALEADEIIKATRKRKEPVRSHSTFVGPAPLYSGQRLLPKWDKWGRKQGTWAPASN